MWVIKWLYCYYLEDRVRDMSSRRDFARALVSSDQDILISALCEDLNRNTYVEFTIEKW